MKLILKAIGQSNPIQFLQKNEEIILSKEIINFLNQNKNKNKNENKFNFNFEKKNKNEFKLIIN